VAKLKLFAQGKYDGIMLIVYKRGNKVQILTDDGQDVTVRLPSCVEELVHLPGTPGECILLSECEMWREGKHQPREVTSGSLFEIGTPEDKWIVLNVFDCIWFGKDIHKLPLSERLAYLDKIKFKQHRVADLDPELSHFNKCVTKVAETKVALDQAIQDFFSVPQLEGAMIKLDTPYELTGRTRNVFKLKKYIQILVMVWRRVRTKTHGVYNYDFGVRFDTDDGVQSNTIKTIAGRKITASGRTFNTKLFAKPGDILVIRFHTANLYKEKKGNRLRLYETAVDEILEEAKLPNSFKEVIEVAKRAHLLAVKGKEEEGSE